MQVWFLVWEVPTCHRATKPVGHNWRARLLQWRNKDTGAATQIQHRQTNQYFLRISKTILSTARGYKEGEQNNKTLNGKDIYFWQFGEFSSVQSLSCVPPFAAPWTAARQASLSITNSQSSLKLMSITSVMPSNHLILSSPSPPTFNLSQHQGLFQWVSSSYQVAKVLEFQLQHQSFQWTFRNDIL